MRPCVLVVFATRSGSTEEVARNIADLLCSRGLEVDVQDAKSVAFTERYSAVVIAAALYVGRLHKDVRRFLTAHRAELSTLPAALFVLGPVHTDEKEWISARQQLDEELAKFTWLAPVSKWIVGGKFDPGRLGFPFNLIPALRHMPVSDAIDWELIRERTTALAEVFLSTAAEIHT